ncbi:lipopolysaccharide core heptose(II) kinase RfaY [Flavobacterium sp. B183]|uniref:lipopolysaccharide core heptose(II) kinase RfaY n=1 Tax=Flavobacterium sp. B183 TaxID=907046 RepID=UPI00201EA3EC|nr:lipopolysaccharide core heptose(II) kinase RfaY [Flavobacterium sp. B183]URC11073.1 AarF/UbiB family protein [Flavobacterium sp. B183]
MIGENIRGNSKIYAVTKRLLENQGDRPNANIYICEDEKNVKYILKHFYSKTPVSFIGYSKHNHYGRRRDGSHRVFNEIQKKNSQYPFLLKHIERIKHKNKWLIILEYIEGSTLSEFVKINHSKDFNKVNNAIEQFGLELKNWHSSEFAHGDPHLDNVMISNKNDDNYIIKLIDYGQLHHPDFHYCKKVNCYKDKNKRINEDLKNTNNKLGNGFLKGLIDLENALNIPNQLSSIFKKAYY